MGLVALAGCGGAGDVVLTATLDEVPLVGLEIVALPFDAQSTLDSLLDSLGRTNPTRRPDYTALEAELKDYQRKDSDSIANLSAEWAEARRAVAELANALNGMERGSAEYASAYTRFKTAYHALSKEEVVLEGRMRRELGSDRDVAARAGAAADSLRRWEEEAYRALADIIAGQDAIAGKTDSLGQVRLELKAGRWWLVARRTDPENPFMEFAWNVPLVVSSIVPVATPLSGHNVTLRWHR